MNLDYSSSRLHRPEVLASGDPLRRQGHDERGAGRQGAEYAIHERILPLKGYQPAGNQTLGEMARRARLGV